MESLVGTAVQRAIVAGMPVGQDALGKGVSSHTLCSATWHGITSPALRLCFRL